MRARIIRTPSDAVDSRRTDNRDFRSITLLPARREDHLIRLAMGRVVREGRHGGHAVHVVVDSVGAGAEGPGGHVVPEEDAGASAVDVEARVGGVVGGDAI